MSNLIKRTVPVILVFIVCITCLAFPAAASSFEVPKTYFNVLEYATPNDFASTAVSLPDSQGTVSFDIPGQIVFSYVDILVSSTSDITSATIGSSQLNTHALSAGMYRLEGTIPYTSYSSISLSLYCSSASVVTFLSFHAYNRELTPRNIVGYIDCYHNGDSVAYKVQSSASITTSHRFTTTENSTDYCTIDCGSDKFHLYDYLAFRFRTNLEVRSIIGMTADGKYPLSLTVSSYNDPLDRTYSYYYCILDVSGISWGDDLVSDKPILQVNCSKTGSQECIFNFYDATGFVNLEYVDPNLSFFRKFQKVISEKIDGVIDELKKITGTGADSDAISAQQKQEEINVSINNQLVGAVEDWNTNIEIVETGYDTAVTKATPALGWLASLADGIFNGMGWFGSIYFLVGLISVIMLILSKSGLAHRLGNITRRGD